MILRIWYSFCAIVLTMVFAPWLIAQTPGPIPNGTNAGNFGATINSKGGHVGFGGGPPPSLNAACGTAPSGPFGTDSAFHFVSGTSSSSTCTVTPATAWGKRPSCSVDSEAGSVAYSVSDNGAITISGVADSTRYHVICIGQPGGF